MEVWDQVGPRVRLTARAFLEEVPRDLLARKAMDFHLVQTPVWEG